MATNITGKLKINRTEKIDGTGYLYEEEDAWLDDVEVSTPVEDTDPASKAYVDSQIAGVNEADEITVDASGFSGLLSETDTDVQTALGTLDGVTIPTLDGKVATAANDTNEYLNTKIRAGAGITATADTPTEVTMADEQYADYAALVVGESIAAGDRFTLMAATDTGDNILAFVKSGELEVGDTFQDSAQTTVSYLGNVLTDGDLARLEIATTAMENPMTTAGAIIYGGESGTPTALTAGTEGQVLTMGATNPEWAAAGGGGDITKLTVTTAEVVNTTEETTAVTVTIPANAMEDGDIIKIMGYYKYGRSGTGQEYIKLYVGEASWTMHSVAGSYGTTASDIYNELTLIRQGTNLAVLQEHRNYSGFSLPINNELGPQDKTFDYADDGEIFTSITYTSDITITIKVTESQANAADYLKPQGVRAYLYS